MNVAYFVTGMGRSGTLWLARLLDEDPGVACRHEALGKHDVKAYGRIYNGELEAVAYLEWRKGKMEEVYHEVTNDAKGDAWGEVNSYLRYVAPELRDVFECPVAGIVRDGRYTVRSLLARKTYRKKGYPPIKPPDELRHADPFAQTCWYWADAYRRLEMQGVPIFQLEQLNSDYGCFQELCDYLGADVSAKAWKSFAGRRMHTSQPEDPPHWRPDQEAAFARLAGDVQERYYAGGS